MKATIIAIISLLVICLANSQSWQQKQLTDIATGVGAVANGIFFHDTGLVIGGAGDIYHTNDFFNTYYVDSSHQPDIFEGGLSFANRNIGYITDPYVRDGLLKTIDGGTTWQPVPFGHSSGDNWGNILICTGPDTVYAVLLDLEIIHRTFDGGVTWSEGDITIPQTPGIARMQVMKDSIFYVLCSTSQIGTRGFYRLIKSTDYGITWQLVSFIPTSSDYNDFHFIDDTTVIMPSSHIILRSTDAGATFDTVMYSASPYDVFTGFVNSISFVSHDTGFVAFAAGVYRTYDAGKSWTKTSFFFDSTDYGNNLIFIYAVSSQKILVGCNKGNIYRTVTGGGVAEDVPELSNNYQLSLYPNPATTQLLISTNNFNPQTITIYNLNGQRVLNLPFAHVVNIAALPPGVYFVEVTGKEASEVRKLVKM